MTIEGETPGAHAFRGQQRGRSISGLQRSAGLGLLVLAFAVFAGFSLLQTTESRSVETSRLVITDSQGKRRIILDVTPATGNPALRLLDPQGRERVVLNLAGHGSGALTFIGSDGKPTVGLYAIGDERAVLKLHGGEVIVELSVAGGIPTLQLGGPKGAVAAVLGATPNGSGFLLLMDNAKGRQILLPEDIFEKKGSE